eukprot:CAMPEP_0181322722 /NCGR_PEP_ID=MMETSP1101-20121128/19381_1 /TAXON_ID=46948 /ORGANISM="Rhodomonas abbreviata, Strain Caron Lab Isolate" /LENGTH=34 /DNA_ID= /DNA_START= /DNA_END= /DNA_ORIENTATION=
MDEEEACEEQFVHGTRLPRPHSSLPACWHKACLG